MSIDCDGQICEDVEAKARSMSLEGSTNQLFFKSICQRVKPAAQPIAPAPAPAPAGGRSASVTCLPDAGIPGRADAAGSAHSSVKPARFPQICSFSLVLQPPVTHLHLIGSHVRMCSHDALLCIGTEFEICAADASDCFGKVVACSLTPATSVYTVDVQVFRHVVYLPCSPQRVGTILSETFHVFVEANHDTKSHQLVAEIARRTAAAAANRDADCADARQRTLADISAKKARAKVLASRRIGITVDQLGMVRLRQAFLIAQPLVSEILKLLMEQWQPDAAARTVECSKVFKSSDGPWDVFSVFSFLLRRRSLLKLNRSYQVDTAERDTDREQLETIMKQIYAVRNWWAHVSVAAGNCRQALVALRQFIILTPDGLKPPVAVTSSVCDRLECIERSFLHGEAAPQMTIDDISYFYFGRASRHLSLMCTCIMEQAPQSLVSVYLKQRIESKDPKFRQRGVVEAVDVTRALLALNEHQATKTLDAEEIDFDCETIRIARNNFAHAPDSGNRVIMVLLALGSLSRVISVISRMCAADPASASSVQQIITDASKYKSEIDDWQLELLERAGMVDVKALIDAVCEGHANELDSCEYAPWATDNYRRLRLLTKNQVVGEYQAPADVENVAHSMGKEQRALVNVVARVPPASRSSSASAADWLLSRVKNCEESAQHDHMQDLISTVQKAVPQDAQVQRAFTLPRSDGDIDQARAAIIR